MAGFSEMLSMTFWLRETLEADNRKIQEAAVSSYGALAVSHCNKPSFCTGLR